MRRADLVILSQAGNSDDVYFGNVIRLRKQPYVVIVQDEAMERAWSHRNEWREIGAAAATKILTLVPSDSAEVMAATLVSIATMITA